MCGVIYPFSPRFTRFFLSKITSENMMAITDKAVESSTSSFFKTIFNKATNEDSPAHSPFSLDQNPQVIAVKLISVEHDYYQNPQEIAVKLISVEHDYWN
jgi:hypothetical protein